MLCIHSKKEAPGGAAEDLSIMLCRNRAHCGLAGNLIAVDSTHCQPQSLA